MFLPGHALNRSVFLVPYIGDVQEHIRAPLTLFGLMRLEGIDRGCPDNLLARSVTFCLGDDPRFLSEVHCQRVVVVVRVLQRVAEYERRLDAAHDIGQAEQRVLVSPHGVIPNVEKLHTCAKYFGCSHRLLLASSFHLALTHVALSPKLCRLAPLAVGQANDVHVVTLLGVQRDGATCTPYKIGRMGADNQCVFL
ncbi:hypothetical protein D3C79_826430 [compost metagenome]